MFRHFNTLLFFTDYNEIYSDNIEINKYEVENDLNKEDNNDKNILEKMKPLLNEIDNIEEPKPFEYNEYISNKKIKRNNKNKKKKNKKMKNYNIRKGDWQCQHCKNINFHFRIICNVCLKNKN